MKKVKYTLTLDYTPDCDGAKVRKTLWGGLTQTQAYSRLESAIERDLRDTTGKWWLIRWKIDSGWQKA